MCYLETRVKKVIVLYLRKKLRLFRSAFGLKQTLQRKTFFCLVERANTTFSFNIRYFNDYTRLFHRGKHILNWKISLKETCAFIDLPFKPNSVAEQWQELKFFCGYTWLHGSLLCKCAKPDWWGSVRHSSAFLSMCFQTDHIKSSVATQLSSALIAPSQYIHHLPYSVFSC